MALHRDPSETRSHLPDISNPFDGHSEFQVTLNTIPQKLQIQMPKPSQTFLFLHDLTFTNFKAQRINTLPHLNFHIVSFRFALIWHPVLQSTNAMSECPMNFNGI